MDGTELTYNTAALGRCIHGGETSSESLQAVGMRTNRLGFFGGEVGYGN